MGSRETKTPEQRVARAFFCALVKFLRFFRTLSLRPSSPVRVVLLAPFVSGAAESVEFLVLALHLVQDDRMQRIVALWGWRVIFASPRPETNLLNRIDI